MPVFYSTPLLKHYPEDLKRRQEVADIYNLKLKALNSKLILPFIEEGRISAWAQYSIRVENRDELQVRLKEQEIPTAVHYPLPLHLQECFKYLGYIKDAFPISELISQEIISLPMNPYILDNKIKYISENL